MKPLKLIMEGFESYKNKTEIDFTPFDGKLFLICGDTGSGKTSIFDAISFALFGKASGSTRSEHMLRCNFANYNGPSYVDFSFLYGDKRYRIYRTLEHESQGRGGKTVLRPKTVTLYENDIIKEGNKTKINDEIRRILGIDAEQFSRISMLPQGDFSKFLSSDSATKTKILSRLFNTAVYQKLIEALKNRLAEKRARLKELQIQRDTNLHNIRSSEEQKNAYAIEALCAGSLLDAEALTLISHLIKEDEAAQKASELTLKKEEDILQQCESLLQKAQEKNKLLSEQRSAAEKKETLKHLLQQQKSELEELKKEESKFETLKQTSSMLADGLPLFDELEHARIGSLKSETLLSELHAELLKKQEKKEQLKKQIAVIDAQKDEHTKQAKMLFQNQIALRDDEALILKLTEYLLTVKNMFDQKQELSKADTLLAQEEAQFKCAREKYERAHERFLNEQASFLAQTLADGAPCPVCGSLNHPNPAKAEEIHLSKEQLQNLKDNADKAKSSYDHALTRKNTLSELLKRLKSDFGDKKSTLIAHIKEEEQKITLMQSSGEEHIEKAEDVLNEIQYKKSLREKEISEQEKNIDLLSLSIQGYEKHKQEMDILDSDIRLGMDQKAALSAEHSRFSTDFSNHQKQLNKIYENAGVFIEHEEAYSKAYAEEKIRHMTQQISGYETEKNRLESSISECQNKLQLLEGEIKQLLMQIQALPESDETALLQQKGDSLRRKETLQDMLNDLYLRIHNNTELLKKLKSGMEKLKAAKEEVSVYETLYQSAAGQLAGKSKINLESFAQTYYFDRMLEKANARLNAMSASKYSLIRKDDDRGLKNETLAINVYDAEQGSERSAASLSGGETFLASLALALGLSDEVIAQAGGLELNSLFIDEGFGTLDESTLTTALCALGNLSSNRIMVGVISHVDRLKRVIPNKIKVHKDSVEGSSISIETE